MAADGWVGRFRFMPIRNRYHSDEVARAGDIRHAATQLSRVGSRGKAVSADRGELYVRGHSHECGYGGLNSPFGCGGHVFEIGFFRSLVGGH